MTRGNVMIDESKHTLARSTHGAVDAKICVRQLMADPSKVLFGKVFYHVPLFHFAAVEEPHSHVSGPESVCPELEPVAVIEKPVPRCAEPSGKAPQALRACGEQ